MKKMPFEEAMVRLEEIVGLLESGNQPLEESLKLFEEGTKLAQLCNTTLSKAKLKITELSGDGDSAPKEDKPDE